MYSINKLQEAAKKLEDKYGEIVLDTDYKTTLFHAHLDTAIGSLDRAAELIGPEEPDLDSIPNSPSSNVTLAILGAFFVILLWILK